MICPYNRKHEKQIQQWVQEYSPEDSNQVPSGTTITDTDFTMMECPKENCGAWHGGKCCYASVTLDNQ